MRIVFAGTPEPAACALRALSESRHEIVGVLTRPEARSGRGRRSSVSPVATLAAELEVPLLAPAKLGAPESLAALRELEPDCCPVVAYGALIPPSALAIPRIGWINLHFSLLPAWRGAAPVHHAVRAGDEITGASTFLIEEGLDTGPVFGTVTDEIGPADTTGSVLDRLSATGARLLVATLDGISDGTLGTAPQPSDGVSLAPKVTVADARIDFTAPALAVDRQIRSCTPQPGPWTHWRGDRVKLGPVALGAAADIAPLAPGELYAEKKQVWAGTGTAAVRLSTVQPAGRGPMDAADWARGARPAAEERFNDE